MSIKLVDNAKDAWKWYSVQASAVLTVAPVVWMELPADLKSQIPDAWLPYIVSLVALGGLVGRLKAQTK